MKIIAVDDERLALNAITGIIRELEPDSDCESFMSTRKAIAYVEEHAIDIAFLDIEMFDMNGIELAKRLKELCPKVNIIFMTGFSEYAVDAMALRASGYLLKPANRKEVKNELEHLRHPMNLKKTAHVFIQTFGNFEIFVDEKPLLFTRSKSKELLAYLVDRKGAGLGNSEIAAVLYEDRAYSRSLKNQVQNAIRFMMEPLKEAGIENIIIRKWNNLALDTSKIECDYYQFIEGDIASINAFTGEYMNNYSWAEFTTGSLVSKAI